MFPQNGMFRIVKATPTIGHIDKIKYSFDWLHDAGGNIDHYPTRNARWQQLQWRLINNWPIAYERISYIPRASEHTETELLWGEYNVKNPNIQQWRGWTAREFNEKAGHSEQMMQARNAELKQPDGTAKAAMCAPGMQP